MAHFFVHLGAWGLGLLGVIDGVLFAPFGLDILLIVLVARHPERLLLYVIVATAGSTLGYLALHAIWRKGGEEGLRSRMKPAQFERIRKKMEQNAGKAVAIGALLPPPFPFTPVVAGAAAFQFPRKKLFPILVIARGARFTIVALLAQHYGRHLIRMIEAPAFRWFVIALIALSLIGSGVVIYRWRRPAPGNSKEAVAIS